MYLDSTLETRKISENFASRILQYHCNSFKHVREINCDRVRRLRRLSTATQIFCISAYKILDNLSESSRRFAYDYMLWLVCECTVVRHCNVVWINRFISYNTNADQDVDVILKVVGDYYETVRSIRWSIMKTIRRDIPVCVEDPSDFTSLNIAYDNILGNICRCVYYFDLFDKIGIQSVEASSSKNKS
ncbi:hypothetical protein [Heliothis virescens ascovirus 3h]|uniref:Uncharacterized protein n=1 Tax=Heliothis virescens ascovirus 3h TaxID=1268039 RepID=A0A386JAL1_9VIRU|nr:hypothetical protein [Heliothis virescens ascovirus 3h]